MAGTKAGGAKTAEANKKRHGADYYARIGRMGGKKTTTELKGFAYAVKHLDPSHPAHPLTAGQNGRRGKAKV